MRYLPALAWTVVVALVAVVSGLTVTPDPRIPWGAVAALIVSAVLAISQIPTDRE